MTAREYNNVVQTYRTTHNAIMNAMPVQPKVPGAPKKNNKTHSRVYRLHENNNMNNNNDIINNNEIDVLDLNTFHATVGNAGGNNVFHLTGGPGQLPSNVQRGGRRSQRKSRKVRKTYRKRAYRKKTYRKH